MISITEYRAVSKITFLFHNDLEYSEEGGGDVEVKMKTRHLMITFYEALDQCNY